MSQSATMSTYHSPYPGRQKSVFRIPSFPLLRLRGQASSEAQGMPVPTTPLSEHEAIKNCLPEMLLIRITSQYGDHAIKECKKLDDHRTETKVKPSILWALSQKDQWRSLCDKIDRELRYSKDSKDLPEDWRLETPYIEMIDSICEETGWEFDVVIEEMQTYAYAEQACFIPHKEREYLKPRSKPVFVNPFSQQLSFSRLEQDTLTSHDSPGSDAEPFWQSPDAEWEALLQAQTDEGQCNHTHRRSVTEVKIACEWEDLHAAVERDLALLDMIFPAPSQEGTHLKDIVTKVQRTYFRKQEEEETNSISLSRRASKLSEKSNRAQKVAEKLASKGEMNAMKRSVMKAVFGMAVRCKM